MARLLLSALALLLGACVGSSPPDLRDSTLEVTVQRDGPWLEGAVVALVDPRGPCGSSAFSAHLNGEWLEPTSFGNRGSGDGGPGCEPPAFRVKPGSEWAFDGPGFELVLESNQGNVELSSGQLMTLHLVAPLTARVGQAWRLTVSGPFELSARDEQIFELFGPGEPGADAGLGRFSDSRTLWPHRDGDALVLDLPSDLPPGRYVWRSLLRAIIVTPERCEGVKACSTVLSLTQHGALTVTP